VAPNGTVTEMYDAILTCCRWLEHTSWGITIRASSWMYPVVLWIHFIGLSMWLGIVLAADLRLLEVGSHQQTAVELTQGLYAWKWIGFGIAFVAGFLLLSAEATTYVTNAGIRLKLAVLIPLALMWHLVVQKHAPSWARAARTPARGKWAAGIEFILWMSVVAASVGFLLTNAVTHP
jgi:hypothetical protein